MGKSFYIHRLVNALETDCTATGGVHRIVTLHGPDVSIDMVVKMLSAVGDDGSLPTVLHVDVSERVRYVDLSAAYLYIYLLCLVLYILPDSLTMHRSLMTLV